MDLDDMELDDLGIPTPDEGPESCAHCNASPEHSVIDDTVQVFHYENCYLMNPDNFLVAA